jgi:hypothetical protein
MKTDKEFFKKRPILTSIFIFIVIAATVLLVIKLTKKDIGDLAEGSDSLYNFQRSTSDLSQREVVLYFSSSNDSFLHPEKRLIYDTESVTDQAKQIIVELLKGPKTDLRRTIPEGTKLRELFLDKYGTVYVDLTSEVVNNIRGGSETEILLIYSIVNTLTDNFTQFKLIRFLVDGREVETFNGHLDLAVSYFNRPDLIYNPDSAVSVSSKTETGDSDAE